MLDTTPGPDHDWRVGLSNKVIAITGANRGIGLGIVHVCLANDAAVVYSLDLFEPGDEFGALREANPPRLKYLNCDVISEDSTTAAIDAIIAGKSAIHGLVANAGTTKHQPSRRWTSRGRRWSSCSTSTCSGRTSARRRWRGGSSSWACGAPSSSRPP